VPSGPNFFNGRSTCVSTYNHICYIYNTWTNVSAVYGQGDKVLLYVCIRLRFSEQHRIETSIIGTSATSANIKQTSIIVIFFTNISNITWAPAMPAMFITDLDIPSSIFNIWQRLRISISYENPMCP
ncbi:unnamed protein product, partial [Ectocarpus sp. 12 AP-2014]